MPNRQDRDIRQCEISTLVTSFVATSGQLWKHGRNRTPKTHQSRTCSGAPCCSVNSPSPSHGTCRRGKGRRLRHGGARAAFPWPELLRSKSKLYDPGPRTWLRSVADVELCPPRRNPILTRRSTAAMSLRRSSHHFASTMLSTMLLMAAVASWGVVTANPRPNDVFGTTIDEEPSKHQGSLADQKPLSSGTSQRDACSLDDYLATLTLSDMEKVIERYAKLQGMTVSGLIKQLYSSLYSSIKRKVVTNERLSPMALEAMQELCVSGLGPAYQVGPIGGPLASGMPGVSGFLLPNTEFAPLPPLRTLRPPPGARLVIQAGGLNDVQLPEASIVVSPQMTLWEALRRADYKLAADTGLGEGVLQLGFSATRACYIVEAVAGLKATPDRAWKIAINDRFGKLVFEDVCLPGKDDLVVHPKMTITLTYSDVKRTTV